MRRRQLKWLWARRKQLCQMILRREDLLMKLGAAKQKAPSAWRLIEIEVANQGASLSYRLHKEKLRRARRREGRYLLRTNLTESDPAKLWSLYLQLVAVEEAFKNLKGDLAVRPIFHQKEKRVQAHIFVSFLGLLSARNTGTKATYARARAHTTQWPGEVRRHADRTTGTTTAQDQRCPCHLGDHPVVQTFETCRLIFQLPTSFDPRESAKSD